LNYFFRLSRAVAVELKPCVTHTVFPQLHPKKSSGIDNWYLDEFFEEWTTCQKNKFTFFGLILFVLEKETTL
jgi:hypothetical protein